MSNPENQTPVPGSERAPLPGARVVGAADPNERIEVTVLVRPRPSSAAPLSVEDLGAQLPGERRHLSREEYEAAQGADPEDLAQVEAFAHEHGLDVVEASAARRTIVLSGTIAALSAAFGVELARYQHPGGSYRGRVGNVNVPAQLAPIVQAVLGLDDRPQADPHFRRAAAQAQAQGTSYLPTQVAQLYNFPAASDGSGQAVAIIELGGGYRAAELKTYFAQLGLAAPKVTAVSVDGGHNRPGADPNADGEVMLDIEVAGAIAPRARFIVYFAPNTDRGFLDAITKAVHDTRYRPSVISISWGGAESTWTAQAVQAFNQAFQAAATLGVTVCCAAGDDGSADRVTDGLAHVDFPASSPYVLACGGTRLQGSGGAITQEVVWNEGPGAGATGGGISAVFAPPAWQSGANVPPSVNPDHTTGRGVPDVSGDADPATGYSILVDGQHAVFGGTSAVAPLWAGLIARINQHLKQPVGYFNPLLYQQLAAAGTLRDITSGNNGAYQAAPGWDACTGFGSPDGAKLLKALGG